MSASVSASGVVVDTLTRLSAAWNAGDAAAYAAEFTEDATYVVFDGTVLRGRSAIDDVHRMLFDGPLKGSRMPDPAVEQQPEIRFVRPDVAHVLVTGGVRLDGQEELPIDRVSVPSFLLVETDGAWRIAAFQNTRRQPRGTTP